MTLGVVLEPDERLSASLNYYSIRWKNKIVGRCCQDIVDGTQSGEVLRDPATNQILMVFGSFENIGRLATDGLDVEARYRFSSSYGRWTGRVNATYVHSFKEDDLDIAGSNAEIVSMGALPRVRANAAVDWDWRAFLATIQWRYVAGVKQEAASVSAAGFFEAQDPRFQTGVLPRRTPSYATWDFYGAYRPSRSLTLSAAVLNVFNKPPPYDPAWTTLFDFAHFDVRGVQYRVGLTWRSP